MNFFDSNILPLTALFLFVFSTHCRYLIVTTGIATPRVPKFPGVELSEGYEDLSMDQEEFEGQSVLILGRGNSAFETADHIIANTNVIHMMARSRVRLAWATHYVGDLRYIDTLFSLSPSSLPVSSLVQLCTLEFTLSIQNKC